MSVPTHPISRTSIVEAHMGKRTRRHVLWAAIAGSVAAGGIVSASVANAEEAPQGGGMIQICAQSNAPDQFNFEIGGIDRTFTVAAGQCSNAIPVSSPRVSVVE